MKGKKRFILIFPRKAIKIVSFMKSSSRCYLAVGREFINKILCIINKIYILSGPILDRTSFYKIYYHSVEGLKLSLKNPTWSWNSFLIHFLAILRCINISYSLRNQFPFIIFSMDPQKKKQEPKSRKKQTQKTDFVFVYRSF